MSQMEEIIKVNEIKRTLEIIRRRLLPPRPCSICGKWLTDPDSKAAGMGKVCREYE